MVSAPSTLDYRSFRREDGGSRSGFRREGHHGDHGPQAYGWKVPGSASPARPPAKAGHPSQFSIISKPTSTISFGPSSAFSKKGVNREAISSAYTLSVWSRKPSAGLDPDRVPAVEGGGVRKRLNLLPRSKPMEAEVEKSDRKGQAEPAPEAAIMSEADAQKKVKEDIKVRLFGLQMLVSR